MMKRRKLIMGVMSMAVFVLMACGTESESTTYERPDVNEVDTEIGLEEPTRTPAVPSTSVFEVTQEEAVELARAHLEAMGVTDARFEYVYLDVENGVQVWSIEFEHHGVDYEFYVDVQTGQFLRVPDVASSEHASMISLGTLGRAPAGFPDTPAISHTQAAEIALGLVPGTLIEVDHDFENGVAVWYVGIRDGQAVHEIYVDVQTGHIVLHETDFDG